MPYTTARSVESRRKRGVGFANPENNCCSFFFDGAVLVGFINLYEEETEVFFGIGADPDRCGYDRIMTGTACEVSRLLFT